MNNTGDRRPIGVFDSGVGGLTVLKELICQLPQESYIYIGDTKNLPYGNKSPAIVKELAIKVTKELIKHDVKALVVACNTISAVALDEVKLIAKNIPVVDVIDPTVNFALLNSIDSQIAVIATETTIRSGIYEYKIKQKNKRVKIFSKATPAFVPLIEEKPHDHPLINDAIEYYLSEIKLNKKITSLILGCTHYPLIKKQIENYLGENVSIIDSANPTATFLKQILKDKKILHGKNSPTRIFFTSDDPSRSINIAREFLGGEISLEKIVIS